MPLSAVGRGEPMTPVLRVEDLHHTYLPGTPFEAVSLRGVNMEVQEGEIVAIRVTRS